MRKKKAIQGIFLGAVVLLVAIGILLCFIRDPAVQETSLTVQDQNSSEQLVSGGEKPKEEKQQGLEPDLNPEEGESLPGNQYIGTDTTSGTKTSQEPETVAEVPWKLTDSGLNDLEPDINEEN